MSRTRALLVCTVFCAAVAVAAGCSNTPRRALSGDASPVPIASVSLFEPQMPAGSGGGATGGGPGSGGGTGSGSGGGGSNPGTGSTGPHIVYFRLTQAPKCAEGTAVVRAPAVPAIISWKVTGATKVALSVDNPNLVGSYGTYSTESTQTFMFSCGGPVGSTETHTYTINTVGPGPVQRAQITASARVLDSGGGVGATPPTGG